MTAGTETPAPEPPLCNWINVFEVALIPFALPLLPPGLSGTVPIPAASHTLRALQRPESSPNKQQFLGHCSPVILCCFVERSDCCYHLRSIPTTGPTPLVKGKLSSLQLFVQQTGAQDLAQRSLDQLFKD